MRVTATTGLLLVSCRAAAPVDAEEPVPRDMSPPVVAVADVPRDMAKETAKDVPKDTPPREPVHAVAAGAPLELPGLRLVMRADCQLSGIFALADGGVAVLCQEVLAGAAAGETSLTSDAGWGGFANLHYASPQTMAGRWPDALFVTFHSETSRTTSGYYVASRVEGEWRYAAIPAPAGVEAFYDAYAHTPDGRVLATRVHQPRDGYPFEPKEGGRKATVPTRMQAHRVGENELEWFGAVKLDLLVGAGPKPPTPPTSALVLGLAASAGEVLLFTTADMLRAPFGGTRWKKVPELDASVGFAADGALQAIGCAAEKTTLFRLDGERWAATGSIDGCVERAALATDGVVWGVRDDTVVRARAAEAWEVVPGLPAPLERIDELTVIGDAAWVAVTTSEYLTEVYTSRADWQMLTP